MGKALGLGQAQNAIQMATDERGVLALALPIGQMSSLAELQHEERGSQKKEKPPHSV